MKIDTIGSEDVYFVAPPKYLGDKRFAYTFSLSFKLLLRNASIPVASSKGDVILVGRWFDQPLVASLSSPPSAANFSLHEVRPAKILWLQGRYFLGEMKISCFLFDKRTKKRVSTYVREVQGKNLKNVN